MPTRLMAAPVAEMNRLALLWIVSWSTVDKARIMDMRYKMTPTTVAMTTVTMRRTVDMDNTTPGTFRDQNGTCHNQHKYD